VYVPSFSRKRVCPPPGPKGGGAHSPAAKGVGESQFQRLEKRLALCLLCAMRGGLWRKSINDRKGSRYRDYDAAFGTFHSISKCFHRRKQNLYVYFPLQPGSLEIKKRSVHGHKVQIQPFRLCQKYLSHDPALKQHATEPKKSEN
jgi:hypothetical protein